MVVRIVRKIDSFKGISPALKQNFNVEVFANTLREVISTNQHLWGAIKLENELA